MSLEDDKFNGILGSLVDKNKGVQRFACLCQSQQTHRNLRSGDRERLLAFTQTRCASYMMMRKMVMMVAATVTMMMAAETSITLCQL